MKAVAAIIVLVLVVLAIASQAQFKQASAWECGNILSAVGYEWMPVEEGDRMGRVPIEVRRNVYQYNNEEVDDPDGVVITTTKLWGRYPISGVDKVTARRELCFYTTNATGQAHGGTQHEMPQWLLTVEVTFCGNHQQLWPRPCVRNGMIVMGVIAALVIGSFVGLALMFNNSLPPEDYDGYGAI